MNVNEKIVQALSIVGDAYRTQGVVHKWKAYRTAIDTIRQVDFVITSAQQLKGRKGIGQAMIQKVAEILSTGELQQEHDVREDPVANALRLFTAIHGIGPVLARKLVDEGHRTLEDLHGVHLPAAARLGLQYHAETSERIPFAEVEDHLAFVRDACAALDPALAPVVCGSHRRNAATSGDVDVLLTHPLSHSQSGQQYTYLAHLVVALRRAGYVKDTLAEGPSKFMGYAVLPGGRTRRLDMRWIPFDSFAPALLYFTGCDMFNIHFRQDALKAGWTVNEYRVQRQDQDTKVLGAIADVHSEKDIFDTVGATFVAPPQRTG